MKERKRILKTAAVMLIAGCLSLQAQNVSFGNERTTLKKAFEKIEKGGILFTFSCSQVVSKDHFRNAVFTAAAQAKRKVRILHQLHQPADHPINIYHPEGEYLKGLVLYVE
jgi:23S rRNA G2069 N7-methylase RlmK/C1962 C5-methylase RlmI